MSAEYAALLQRIEELENDTRFLPHIGALRKEFADMLKNFRLEVAKGNIPGHTAITKFGRNGAVAASTTEEIWSVSTDRTVLTVAATMEAISTDIDDSDTGGTNPASTGARIITIQGVDDSWNRAEEDITMDGTTASTATSTSFFRVDRAFVKATGTYAGTNEGTITIRVSSAGSTQAQIEIGKGQTEMAMYTVPTGHKVYIDHVEVNSDATRLPSFELYQYTGIDDIATPFVGAKRKIWGVTSVAAGSHVDREVDERYVVTGPADIVFECTAASGGASAVEATFDLTLVQDGY